MQAQLDVYKEEHGILRKELVQLLRDNQSLNSQLNDDFKERVRNELQSGMKPIAESEMIITLKKQLDAVKNEKERTYELYQTSLKIVEKLEEEIRFHQNNYLGKDRTEVSSMPKINIMEAKLKNMKEQLEMESSAREHLESENVKYQTEIAKLQINLQANADLMDKARDKDRDWKDKHMKLEQEFALLSATLDCVVKSRNDLEGKIETYNRKIHELVLSNHEAKNKVEEALDIVEKAIRERDAAIIKETQLQEEINQLQLCLQHVIDEAGKKVGCEVEDVRKKYEENISELLKDIPDLKNELQRKSQDLKRITMKYKRLEKTASAKLDKEKISLIRGSETELTILESQLSSVYQELERLRLKHEDLLSEKKALEVELGDCRTLLSDKETQELQLKEQINHLESRIQQKVEDLDECRKRTEFFDNQIRELQKEKKVLSKAVENCNCEKLKIKLKKANVTRSIQMTELEEQVESQMELNQKWKNEVKEMTEKFQERMCQVKKETERLRSKNKKLHSELSTARNQIVSLQKTQ